MPRNENAAALAGDHGVNNSSRATNATSDPTERLLSRLDRVRRCGKGWIARCPAHEDKTASLSVAVGDDGRVLLHCFAGCLTTDIVGSMGLEVGDLFVRKPTANMTFAERAALREHARQAQWKAALNVLGLETKIVVIAGRQIKQLKQLNDEDEQRLDVALQRIDDAREVLCGR